MCCHKVERPAAKKSTVYCMLWNKVVYLLCTAKPVKQNHAFYTCMSLKSVQHSYYLMSVQSVIYIYIYR